ncbi:fumarylacetoacetate hydrolase family protein [Glaciimonas immobilis]|uniref:2-keto-4-pentenoate hydratase/2-oxohepta-3-ene-1,7-dioic acid hydratase in catechol pathway n=1 Tax=Glaciimonas immobilis TaxID=728004 RepID=A0A840RRS0_9BURK|nr:fumarylacetoacetate hydrolase family protein [Glaciimonas immobilis]KAF3997015.1 fumarylacetoacetate hydrolase family protein [Glaciimonas immobilis]MBB5199852.1 2-keto-4-pentenoate hydratase/2-oxohepta-3-ene-1,7-dioic acid hydratase in catechol pathway [Glaciimonas immobilis]
MKLITYRKANSGILTGVVIGERVLDISAWIESLPVSAETQRHSASTGICPASSGILRWMQSGSEAIDVLHRHVRSQIGNESVQFDLLKEVQLYAPVPRPGKIIGIGRNYADHAKETGVAPFENPRIIFKVPSSVAAPGAAVPRPPRVNKLDFEVELAVVIGGYGKNVPASEALSLVAGYTILNDLSAREFQLDTSPAQTSFAKSMDSFAPMGPWMITREEIPDPQTLEVSTWLNGTRMQHAHTSDMLFPVSALIAYISQFMTLEPGDIISTGTPAGIGAFRQPPQYLQPGDQLRFEVTGVGTMAHQIV